MGEGMRYCNSTRGAVAKYEEDGGKICIVRVLVVDRGVDDRDCV